MPEYFNSNYRIILPQEYFLNASGYSFEKLILPKGSISKEIIHEDYSEYLAKKIENEDQLLWDSDLMDEVNEHQFNTDYFILDCEGMEEILDLDAFDFFLKFVDLLDTDLDKFKLLKKLHLSRNNIILIKLRRISRNQGSHPINSHYIDSLISILGNYRYSDSINLY